MRVSLVALHFSEYAARLALALAANGHAVQLHLSDLNALRELDASLAQRLATAVELHRVPHPTRKAAALHGARIAAAIRRFRPDVVHAQEAAHWTTAIAVALARRPLVLTVHDPLPHSGADRALVRQVARPRSWLRRRAAAIIVHGPTAAREMAEAGPQPAARIHSVMHGVLGETAPGVARLPGRFLFFGRIEEYKGLGVLLDATRRLTDAGRDVRLIVAGRGSDLDQHRAAIAALPAVDLDDRFIPADEIPALFAEATATVMPYLDATQSGVAALSFMAGTPVIASAVGALPDVIQDGTNGLLVPARDAAALAAAMEAMLDPPTATRLAGGAAETARTTLAWDRIAGDTAAIYASLARRNHPDVALDQQQPA